MLTHRLSICSGFAGPTSVARARPYTGSIPIGATSRPVTAVLVEVDDSSDEKAEGAAPSTKLVERMSRLEGMNPGFMAVKNSCSARGTEARTGPPCKVLRKCPMLGPLAEIRQGRISRVLGGSTAELRVIET